jgi:tetratricopeptide (TPR) repeat protein
MLDKIPFLNKLFRVKYYVTLLLIVITGFNSFAQKGIIDSLHNVLKTALNDTGKVNTLNALSSKLWRSGNYDTSLICANQALALAEKLGFEKGFAGAYGNIGVISYYQGDYIKSLDYSLKELKIVEEL